MNGGFTAAEIDTSRPHPARLYNYYLGGKDSYPVDQQAAAAVLRAAPEVRATALENRAFVGRAVRHLVRDAGVRQIIDIGTGIPAPGAVHEIARQIAPGVKVAYVDNDPIVHVHANARLGGDDSTRVVLADLRRPGEILGDPLIGEVVDFAQPVALLLAAVVHFVTDAEDPAGIIATLRDALAPGSYLVLSHATGDFRTDAAVRAAAVYDTATSPLTLRDHAEITRLFAGFRVLEPGVVPMPAWRPDRKTRRDAGTVMGYCGVGVR